MLERLFLGT